MFLFCFFTLILLKNVYMYNFLITTCRNSSYVLRIKVSVLRSFYYDVIKTSGSQVDEIVSDYVKSVNVNRDVILINAHQSEFDFVYVVMDIVIN